MIKAFMQRILPRPVRMAIRNVRILLDRPLDDLEVYARETRDEVGRFRVEAEARLAHLQAAVDGLRADAGDLRKHVEALRGDVDSLRPRVDALRNHVERFAVNLAEVTQTLERVDRGIRDLFNQTRADILTRTDVLLEVLDQRIDRVEARLRRAGERGEADGAAGGRSLEPLAGVEDARRVPSREGLTPEEASLADYLLSFVPEGEPRAYATNHLRRYLLTLRHIPAPEGPAPILDVGSNGQILPALVKRHGYTAIRCVVHPGPGAPPAAVVGAQQAGEERYAFPATAVDVERERFPYGDGEFQGVLCLEVVEHLTTDPMAMLWEINRVLRPGGWLVLTTPNIVSAHALDGLLTGHAPYHFSQYYRDGARGLRHNREYTPGEVAELLRLAGFEARVTTEDAWWRPDPAILELLRARGWPDTLRGDDIVAVGIKRGAPLERYPSSLYA